MTSDAGIIWNIGSVPLISPEALTNIVSAMADMAIVIDKRGHVLSVLSNPFHVAMTDLTAWKGKDVRSLLTVESVPKFDRALSEASQADPKLRAIEINHLDPKTEIEFPVSYTLHQISADGAMLMLGRDLKAIADLQQQLVKAQLTVERDYERQRGFDTRFRVLMHATREPVLFANVGTGLVDEANGSAASFFGLTIDELRGAVFADLFDLQTSGELNAELATAALADQQASLELTLKRNKRRVMVQPSFFRASGTRMMLCRIALASAGSSFPHDEIHSRLAALYDQGPDAIVFTGIDGAILSTNEAFLALTESGHDDDVRGQPLSGFLERGSVEQQALMDSATRSGRIKNYSTKLHGRFQRETPVEISATHLGDDAGSAFAFVLRDTSVTDLTRAAGDTPTALAKRNKGSVVDLVGSTSLKEIVADTTDVIEKMCIETALELTGDNRAAASEMLGLSRQSFYVKLRKFGIGMKPDGE